MKAEQLRKKLHQYIDKLDETRLEHGNILQRNKDALSAPFLLLKWRGQKLYNG